MKKHHDLLLKLGTLQTVFIALYHFFLPYQFQWGQHLSDDIPTINWSLYALNNYFSFDLLILALALAYHLYFKPEQFRSIQLLSLLTIGFWLFSAFYQTVWPMPLPQHLKWLGFVLPGVAVLNSIILAIPLRQLLKTRIK